MRTLSLKTIAIIGAGLVPASGAFAADSPRQLSEGTVLCAAEQDYVRHERDLARPVPAHTLAPSCFYLKEAATFDAVSLKKPTRALVILTSGTHTGAAVWTDRTAVLASGRSSAAAYTKN